MLKYFIIPIKCSLKFSTFSSNFCQNLWIWLNRSQYYLEIFSQCSKNPLIFQKLKACAHWHGLPRGRGLVQCQDRTRSDVRNGIKCDFTHWCGLIRCCLTECGQMRLVKSDHVRLRERIGNCLQSCDTHRHRVDALEMPERKRHLLQSANVRTRKI